MSEQPEIEEAEGMEPVSIATRWGTIGHLGAQGVRLVAFFVLLSMMGRDEFGVFEAALFVTGLAEMIRLAGLPEFLIQARELPARLLASVFWLNLIVAFAMSGVLWLSAGPIAVALNEPRAASLISWLGLAFPVLALTQVHEALLRRQLRFGALAAAQIAGPVAYMVAAVPLAAYGYGPTAFIWGTLADVGVTTFVLWTVCEFRPKGGFRLGDARSAYGFSLALTAADIVHWVTSMSDRAIVLLFFGTKALGVYGTARRLLLQLAKPLTLIYAKVGYPALVACANDAEALRSRYLRALGGVAL
ncbi:MAG: oligosaccharide flippase family protein, partial [Planctomycetota bacterium]|nr:oligosaccharide flippase family protein [Planctomycetota bacterium]